MAAASPLPRGAGSAGGKAGAGGMAMAASNPLPRSTPAAQGVAAAGIAALIDGLAARDLQVHSCMVLRHGLVIAEGWWQPYAADTPHMLFSLSKSFTSTAVGLAVHEGRLSVDDPVTSFFPDDLPATVGPNLAAMRVRHLLTMGTGHHTDTTERVRAAGLPNWARGFLSLAVEHAPGSTFVYNSGASYLLSAIVQRVTGLTLLDYLTPRLFQPLGIEGATWESSPQGINAGGWGLSLKTEDIARFGQLYLQQGRWHGQQVVPEAWVAAATSLQINNGSGGASDWAQGYGYQFWRCRHGAYRGDGAHGQYCIVMPQQDAVIAMTGGTSDLQGVLNCVWDHLLPAMGGGDATQDAALWERLTGLSVAPGQRHPAPGTGAPAAGRLYRLEPNAANLESLTLDLAGDVCRAVVVGAGGARSIECGFDTWRMGEMERTAGQGRVPCAGLAAWEGDGSLRLDWYFVRTPFGRTMRIRAAGGGVEVQYRTNVGEHSKGVTIRGD